MHERATLHPPENPRGSEHRILFYRIAHEIFIVSLLTFFVLYIIEDFVEGFVSNHLDLNIVLGAVVGSGVLTILLSKGDSRMQYHAEQKMRRVSVGVLIVIILLAVVGGGMVWMQVRSLGGIGGVLAVLAALTISVFSLAILFAVSDEDPGDHKS